MKNTRKLTVKRSSLAATPLWGGGFKQGMHPLLNMLGNSLGQDLPLALADLQASASYARALVKCGVLKAREGARLRKTLEQLAKELAAGQWSPLKGYEKSVALTAGAGKVVAKAKEREKLAAALLEIPEDIHTAIEQEVTKRLGALGGKLHTGRSRNDQVVTAFRMTLLNYGQILQRDLGSLQQALWLRAKNSIDILMPGYTHWQRAQPLRLAHWLLNFFWPLARDQERLAAALERMSVLPLGSGALSGHPFGLDRLALAEELGFKEVSQNSLDAIGDRDFALEFAFVCTLIALHLSRLAEELVIFSSSEFGYICWPDDLATGSSLMPQKKNPDLAELIRGEAALAIGDLNSLLVLVKGLASSYHRDLQGDKPPVWRLVKRTSNALAAMTIAINKITFKEERLAEALTRDLLATELADGLVRKGFPFRKAHEIVAALVAKAKQSGRSLEKIAAIDLPDEIDMQDLVDLSAEKAVERRTSIGGTSKAALLKQLRQAEKVLLQVKR